MVFSPVDVIIKQLNKWAWCWHQGWGMSTCVRDWSDTHATPYIWEFIQKFMQKPMRIKLLYCMRRCPRRRLCIDKMFADDDFQDIVLKRIDYVMEHCKDEVGKPDEFKGFFS